MKICNSLSVLILSSHMTRPIVGMIICLLASALLMGLKSVDESVIISCPSEKGGNVYVKVPTPYNLEVVSSHSSYRRAVFVSNLEAWEQSQELTQTTSEEMMLLDVGFGLPSEDLDVRSNIELMLRPREIVYFGDLPDADFGTIMHSNGTVLDLFSIVKIKHEYLRVFIVCRNSTDRKYTTEDWELKKKYMVDWVMRFKEVNDE